MKAKKCPICGKLTLQPKRGDYQLELPPNIPGNTVVVADAEWQHCDSCGEDILSKELEQATNRKCGQGKRSPVA
jgi:YgiT-type zinc finger domain-containing protein